MSRVRHPVRPKTFVSLSTDSIRAVVSYWRKYEHEILDNRLEGLSLPRKSVVRLTDRPDMTIVVYRKTTTQQQQQLLGSWNAHKIFANAKTNLSIAVREHI